MYYIRLDSKIAEEVGEGHSIMSIYNGDLIETPLQQIHTRLYGERSVLPPDKQNKMIPELVNISEAFIVYHPVRERDARVLRGIFSDKGVQFPDPHIHPYKGIEWEEFSPYFEKLSVGVTEGYLSLPEFQKFLPLDGLARLLVDVPEVPPRETDD